ncbi:uncharacterized protein LOC128385533 [Panonychus citri]|uniref:uncharacterized protein LOC128385533 n=1 Tax=Panonychus citri TaxID=50023 RepID=UPI0023070B96|nr:uncharacterized protein LOC128385533 [Panonychus citri]XP_053200380.1 uncharacterized protein LOC128385533 [Panonychus citri]
MANLPDDCLLIIFQYCDDLNDLNNCLLVCKRWRRLVSYRLSKAKCLTDDPWPRCKNDYDDYLLKVERNAIPSGFDVAKLTPNLEILGLHYSYGANSRFVFRILKTVDSIKGLICFKNYEQFSIAPFCGELTMIVATCLSSYFNKYHFGRNLRQLYLSNMSLKQFSDCSRYCTNLRRLHIQYKGDESDICYSGTTLNRLEILEICSWALDETLDYPGFHFMDFCPKLKSAYLCIESLRFPFDANIKNNHLEDLVIEVIRGYAPTWEILLRLLLKFPNLKHLAIRSNPSIEDENIQELVHILPKLVLLDVRNSNKITKESKKYVERFSEQYNRPISFYFNKEDKEAIARDWPKLSSRVDWIARDFNFMRNCFLKPLHLLPYLLIP